MNNVIRILCLVVFFICCFSVSNIAASATEYVSEEYISESESEEYSEDEEPSTEENITQEPVTDKPEETTKPDTPSVTEGIFIPDKKKSKKFVINNKTVVLYECELNIDLTGDKKVSAADARVLLRVSANLEKLRNKTELCDASGDGKITATDARIVLRYSAKLEKFYSDDSQVRLSDFVKDEKGVNYYFTSYGSLADGYTKVGKDFYYFREGKMCTGIFKDSGIMYCMNENGKGYTGFKSITGSKYYFEHGITKKGLITVGSDVYYLNDDGKVHTGWYFDELDAYYFTEDGKMAKNTKIGDVSFDSKGLASTKKITEQTIPVYIRSILKKTGTSPLAIYNYVHNNYRYRLYAKSTPDAMVVRMLSTKRGACYDYAYLTKYLLEAAGYECKVIVGKSFTPTGTEHDWVLVKIDGAWRHIDTQKGTYLKTDAQMRNLGYRWDAQGLPAAV